MTDSVITTSLLEKLRNRKEGKENLLAEGYSEMTAEKFSKELGKSQAMDTSQMIDFCDQHFCELLETSLANILIAFVEKVGEVEGEHETRGVLPYLEKYLAEIRMSDDVIDRVVRSVSEDMGKWFLLLDQWVIKTEKALTE